jgi:hypothetical protein
MQSYKPFQGAVQRNHDIAAIEAIAAIRNKTVHRIENSKALFLTSDHRLTRYNYAEMGHKKNSTIGEVISDTLLTNIIWLKNPNANISLSNIIMSQSQELLINRAVWQKFYENLKRLKQENRINDDTINGLFYGNYVEEELIGLDEAQVDDIDEKFVVDLIDKGRTFAKTDRENKEKDFIKALSEKRTMGRDESEQTWINKVTRVKNGIEEDAAKLAARRANLMATATSLVLLVACWALYTFVPENYHLNWLPTILLGGGGIWAIWTKLRNYLRQYFRERIYSSRVRLAHFEELVAEVDTPK